MSKDGQDKAAGSDEEEEIREPQKFDLTVDTMQIEREKFKSVRDFFGQDEAVYIMDAKTTGNIGRYLNVIIPKYLYSVKAEIDTKIQSTQFGILRSL